MINARIGGLPDLKAALAGIAPKLRVRALRNALAAGARLVQREARANTPALSSTSLPVRKGYRSPGLIRKAISVRTSKNARKRGDVGVFVNVRPAKGGKGGGRGTKNPRDPYYWSWLNFGHKIIGAFKGNYTDYKLRGRGRLTGLAKRRRAPLGFVEGAQFLEKGARMLPLALQAFVKAIGPQIDKLNKPKAPAP